MIKRLPIALMLLFSMTFNLSSGQGHSREQSVAYQWLQVLLAVVQDDGQGPTIEARNMFHTCAAMYDAWAVYDETAETYFLGKTVDGFKVEFDENFKFPASMNLDSAREVTISYAAHRIIYLRFRQYGSKTRTIHQIDSLLNRLGHDEKFLSTDYKTGSPAALGHYIAHSIFDYGLQDGSNEDQFYEPYNYEPVNSNIRPNRPGSQGLRNPNRWQPIDVKEYMLEKGADPTLQIWHNLLIPQQDIFLSPEWGKVTPFALTDEHRSFVMRDGTECEVYLDPGPPPHIDYEKDSIQSEQYKWGFVLVALWSGLMDPTDSVMIDISPGGIGHFGDLPETVADYPSFYNREKGVVNTEPYEINPKTGQPYKPNMVLRGDYLRVIAEYWVDGVYTPSPPGHWLANLQYVTDQRGFERRWEGKGPILDSLEFDIKAYFVMSASMHDAAIAAWGVKGLYDYVRPISAIRYMADQGQCSDPKLPNFTREGLPLIPGRIELVGKKDPLVGKKKEHLNKIKIYCWKGPDYIDDVHTEAAGVGWILAENWWPYQRYSFATPPFAGYVSGHSTFSPCGAELLTRITGDPYWPNGMGTFTAKKNEFLAFEEGPTQDITLQWATYHDAANETCLSRLYGGIHPPADDIPARKMGIKCANLAVDLAKLYFSGKVK